jgi:hypothetical protein
MKQAACFLLSASCTLGCAHAVPVPTPKPPERGVPSSIAPPVQVNPTILPHERLVSPDANLPERKTQPAGSDNPPVTVISKRWRFAPDEGLKDRSGETHQRAEPLQKSLVTAHNGSKAEVATHSNKVTELTGAPEKVKGKAILPSVAGGRPITCAYPNIPNDVWYGVGTICCVVFSSVLAPLLVELIKHRFGVGRHPTLLHDAETGRRK